MGFNVIKKALQQGYEAQYMNYKKIDGAGCIICQSDEFYSINNIVKKKKD